MTRRIGIVTIGAGCLWVVTACQDQGGQVNAPSTQESVTLEQSEMAQSAQLAGPVPPGGVYEGKAFEFEKIQDGIYHARGAGALSVGCNSVVIINEDDVLLVDSHISPAAAWALLKELKDITPKPVRYQVNTHFHFDHLHGNQVYPESVEVIGHEFTREQVVSGKSKSGRSYDSFVGTLPERIAEMEARLAEETDEDQRLQLESELKHQRAYKDATDSVIPTPPNTTLRDRITLFRGEREIRILFFGRAHTGGDVVVHLPAEKILITGDMVTGGVPYMGDGFANEWAETLEHLKGLDFDVILGGHGQPVRDREHLDHLQAYLRDAWTKISAAHADGLTIEAASAQVDLRNHSEHFPQIQEPGVHPHTVARVYELLSAEVN